MARREAASDSTQPAGAAGPEERLIQLRLLVDELTEEERRHFRIDHSIVNTAEPFIAFVTEWTRQHFNCTRNEAFERMKRGSDPNGLPITLMIRAVIEYAMPASRGLEPAMIADLGEETARRYLAEMNRIRDLAIDNPNAMAGIMQFETLNLPRDVRRKYLLTRETAEAHWEAYLRVITVCRLTHI
ncbi:hypothetical protein PSEUBRA_005637 [Kalmanozyma brasiliensis GHG001]|uniref:uncharacterized protein n=1 Tax=Kalmanozyma brasiliensis (strain GHG001) TaxID=1365824 RepID=UPI002867B9DA|nr:uncharacterized protein PSEUBRA_005637 [Kalmanozyma brasiliensis GHG001]KAF6767541.1 hypothetical protein PSEUBRA_005637 [Kalmanozyma brasiliensis GHG001]